MKKSILIFAAALLAALNPGHAQVAINSYGSNVVTENFNSFVGSAASIPTANGFSLLDTGATAWGYQGVGTGTNNTGGVFAYGTGGENSFGFLRSANRAGGLGFEATNSGGLTISGLTIQFDYEQWRYANTSGFTLGGTGALASVDFSAFNFAGAVTGTNGNASSTPITISLSGLNISDGSAFGLAWTYVDQAGSDNGIAIDNFSLSANTTVPEPSTYALIGLGLGALWFLRRKKSFKS